MQYADYAVWQRRWVEGEVLRQQAEYWKRTLSGAPELLELPADRPRPAQQDFAGAALGVVLDEELTAGLKALSRRRGTTLFMTLLAGWAAVLSRLSGQEDLVVGTPTANRGQAEVEGLIGFFVNTLALRLDLSGGPTVGELLERVRERALEAQQNQDIPFEQVVEAVRPARSLAHTPLFQVMLAWQNATAEELALPGLALAGFGAGGQPVSAKYDLSLWLGESEGRITGGLTYTTSLYERATVERHLGYLRRVLEGMAAGPERRVAGLEMLPEAERRQVVEAWNATQAPYPAERCIHELFEAQAERTPDAVAVVFEGEQVSYAELNARANRLAHHLVGLGVGPDARVAVCLERSPELVAVLLAVLKAGGAYVPLDPSYPQERLKHMLADSGPLALLTREDLRDRFEDPDVPVLDVAADAALWAGAPDANPERVGLTPEHLCYVIYTSGSTGRPKGVMNAHRGVVNRLHWMETAHRLAPDEAVLQKTPYSFDVSVWEFFWPLAVGARLVLARPEGHRDTDYLVETIRSRGITTVHFVPSMLGAFLEHPEVGMCTGLRRVVCSGEALPPALVERFGERLPEAELHNLYGPTEAAVDVTAWRCPTDGSAARIPIGAPVANTRMYVLDPSGAPAPAGVAGELHIGGVQVARGYLGRAELTAERFVPDPFSGEAGARLYRTGDVGRWLPDGAIEYLGRNDHQVKVRGFRLEPGEIEACLAEHPGVREAVVLARADGAGDRRLVAYLVGEGPLEPEALRRSLQERLPEHMVPAAYVRLEKLPLTPSGKLDRGALPAPDGEAYARRGYEAPVGEVEQALAEIWAELLGVERVGRNDHFFELGGHSLLAVTLIERMRQRGLHADVRALFTTPRLEDYAAGVDGRSREVEVPPNRIPPECRALVPEMLPLVELEQEEIDRIVAGVPGGAANVQDIYPLAPLQEGILFHHLMTTEGDPYLTSFLTAFDGRERLDAYLGALQAVVQRHDILRTSVVWEGLRQPVQVVWRTAPLLVEEVALGPGDDDPGRQLYRRVAPRRHRIDVTRAPLLRLHLAHDEARGRWFLLMLLHHLADDNTSLRFLHAEIEAHLLGCESELPAPMPFRNYVAQTRRRGSAEEQEAFFRGLLGDVSAPTAPFGLVDARGDGSRAAEARLTLDDGLSRRLRERARALGVSAASLFHVAWAQVLARVSGRMDVVFGTVLFGRMQGGAGSDRVMGPFINTLPVRLRIGEEGVEATVRRMHGLLAELLRHEHASLAVAQRCSGVEPPTPLFTALLNYRNRGGPTRTVERPQAWEGITRVHSEERSNYPLSLSVDDLGEGFKLVAEAHASVVPGRVCRLVQVALERLVEALEAAPTAAVRSLEVLPEEERRQVLEEWNATAAEYPRDACVHELFQAHVKRAPDAVAVVCGAEELSYAELNARANRLAHHLRARGVGPDARVAICAERSPEMIVGLFGILKAGGAYVPLDPAHPRERLREVLQDSRPVAVLTQGQLRPLFAGFHLPVIDVDAAAEWSSLPPTDPVRGELSPEHLAYVIYTSGSTGRPKGVMIQHRSVCQQADALQAGLGIGPGDRNLQFAPVTFDASVEQIFGALLSGAALVLRSDAWLEGARTFWTMCEAHRVSVIDLPARFWQLLAGDPSVPIPDCVRLVEIGGEAVEPAALSDWFRRGGYRPPLHNLYGPTEATVNATHHELTDDSSTWQSIGRPIRNTRVYILDAHGAPVPQGVAGEIHVAGGQVARGYQNLPELTAERFVPDPFGGDPGARLYRTGDLGRWRSDGTIDFLGRTDHQVKIRGYRIELGEIETWLAEHPAVRDAVVLAREDAPGDRRLVAYYVAAQGVEAETLRRHLGERLPEHMVPAAYVRLEEMPLTPNGKVDRRALPAPDGNAYARRGYEAPVGEVERALAEIWAEVLKVERVGRWDNFFELGGHSLLAVQVLGRLHGVLDAPLALADLFSHPTVESLSARVCGSGPELRSDRAIPVRTAGSERPLFLVHEGSGSVAYAQVLHPHIDAGIPVYALPAVSGLEPPLRTVEGMAARLVRMVREVQPEGPYRLAGWSYGGMLAYEMAAQLIGQDQPVEFLGMMDSYYPAAGGSGAGEGRHDYGMLLHMLRMEAGGEGRAPEPGDRELVASRPDLEAFVAGCRERGLLPGHVTAAQAAEMQDRLDVHDRSTRGYRPQPIPLPVHLFSARDGAGADPRRGWQAVLDEASIRVTPVPGTHLSMMEGSNAAAVGRALSHELRRAAAARNALPGERYSPLVTLQRGRLGGGVPTFCVPGAGASVTTFSALAGHLDPAWPVYGLQPRGLDGAMVPHSTVQAAAECCLRAVREVCPEGPVHLVGHSFGGWVAFEMALRLREAGRSPGSLLLLDTEAPDGDGAGIRERDGGEAFLDLVEVLELAMGADFGIAAAEAAALDENGRLKLLHDRMVRHGLMSARLDPTVLQGPFRTFAACARTTYAPSAVYPDRLRLVLLDDPRKDEGANREHFAETVRAWRRWAPGLLVSTGAGNHFTALTPPHVAGLAAHVAADRGAVGSGG
ncbi:MAG TPA: amino acid adenylation domain-containing protein [Longimicrobiaceae bacterium]|nr:amino acid adenylation domain-containing protein [Longimicrobiaceae bacterium]